MAYTYQYPRPAVTVDVIVFYKSSEGLSLLLIQRGREPFKDSWAFPGGFLEMDEELEAGALRELNEETGLALVSLEQLAAFGKIGRDPRGRTISVVFYKILDGCLPDVSGGDDAVQALWFPVDSVPPLAFDHSEVLEKALGLFKLNSLKS